MREEAGPCWGVPRCWDTCPVLRAEKDTACAGGRLRQARPEPLIQEGPAAGSGGEEETEQGVASGPRLPRCRRAWQVHLPVAGASGNSATLGCDSLGSLLEGNRGASPTLKVLGGAGTPYILYLPSSDCLLEIAGQHLWNVSCYRLRLLLGVRVSENFSRSEP